MRVLVLADTHDHLPPKLAELAADVDEIWHLGDVCEPTLLQSMREIGPPLTIVRGNCDRTSEWPLVVDLERSGARFRLIHIPPSETPENIDVLLHGHTHVPRDETRTGVRFLNPGCVTRPKQGRPPTVAKLEIGDAGEVGWELIALR